MSRPWLRVAAILLACIACSLAIAQQRKTDVVLWGVALNENSQGRQAVMRAFERAYPQYRLRPVTMGAGGMDPQKLMTGIVGNVAPDVIIQDRFTISDWASRGAFTPLDGLISRDLGKDPLCPNPSDYYSPVWDEVSYAGHVYAVPAEADNRALYWNRGLFRANAARLRAAGLDPERAPRTWSQLLEYSKVLTTFNADGGLNRAGFIPNYGNSWFYMYAFENDAPFISPDGRSCLVDSPAGEQALQYIVDGYKILGGYDNAQRLASSFLSNENDPFILGKVAMKIDGSWQLNILASDAPSLDFQVAPAPVPEDRLRHRGRFAADRDTFVTWTGGHSYAIPRGARNVDGAWEFIKFATSLQGRLIEAGGQAEWAEFKNRPYVFDIQSTKSANKALFIKYKPSDPRLDEGLSTHIELMDHSRVRPVTFVGQILWNECQRALDNACIGTLTPHQALERDQETVQVDLDAYYLHMRRPAVDLAMVFKILMASGLALLAILAFSYRRLKISRLRRHEASWAFLLISPWFVGFVLLILGPMVASLVLSLTEYNELTDARWVGLANYAAMATTDKVNVWRAFSNAFYLAGIGVPLGIFTGLAIAILLNARVRGLAWYRTLFYMPAIVPTIPSAILWTWVLAADPTRGLVNSIWHRTIEVWLHLPPPGWLQSEAWAKPALVAMGLWGAGSGMILWLAGLKGVPLMLYEASEIDGASGSQQFFSITLPQLSPIIFFNLVVGLIGALQEFDRIYVMGGSGETAGPGDSILMPVYYLFQNAFGYFKVGYASAIAWVLFLIILALTALQFRLAPKWVRYEAGS